MGNAVREETHGHVRRLTLCRPDRYNTITPELRDELGTALDIAERDPNVRVILFDAEGPAFCAGYGLDWSTDAQSTEEARDERVWDSVRDQHMIGSFANTWAKLHDCSKPTVAAVQGWCIAGGTNIVFNTHLIVAGESARFGYPPSRVWGIPEAPWNWVARMGLQNARRYMLTGDEFTAAQALEMGAILEVVPDDELGGSSPDVHNRDPAGNLEHGNRPGETQSCLLVSRDHLGRRPKTLHDPGGELIGILSISRGRGGNHPHTFGPCLPDLGGIVLHGTPCPFDGPRRETARHVHPLTEPDDPHHSGDVH